MAKYSRRLWWDSNSFLIHENCWLWEGGVLGCSTWRWLVNFLLRSLCSRENSPPVYVGYYGHDSVWRTANFFLFVGFMTPISGCWTISAVSQRPVSHPATPWVESTSRVHSNLTVSIVRDFDAWRFELIFGLFRRMTHGVTCSVTCDGYLSRGRKRSLRHGQNRKLFPK
jgi:hypothetical protein